MATKTPPKFHELPKEVVRVSMPASVSRRVKARASLAGLNPTKYLTALACRDLGLNPADFGIATSDLVSSSSR